MGDIVRVKCFWIEPTDMFDVELRRYVRGRDDCDAGPFVPFVGGMQVTMGYHNAAVTIERIEVDGRGHGLRQNGTFPEEFKTDERWPKACRCGHVFTADDMWQRNEVQLWRRSDNGELVTMTDAPVGAMWNADWYVDHPGMTRNEPGVCIVMKTPAGDWIIDGPASNGPGWTRRGVPPLLEVTPSIGIGEPQRFHGWLGGEGGHGEPGVLVIDSMIYPERKADPAQRAPNVRERRKR